ncbi:MAG: 30S ribosomal protein S7 [Spirochaetes bacterium GWF1_51_8]|nr:MAG: 30S ribosomal protein S7 [Spirochaetes bacterium GWF1_51_8]
MPRKKNKVHRQPILPDYKYGSILVTKIVNQIMWDGKKSTATEIVYGAMDFLAEKTGEPALPALEKAMENIKPPIEVRSRRVGGANYQVPVEVRPARQNSLSVRWLVNTSRTRKEHSMAEKLGKELTDAFNNTGTVIKKKLDTIKMAEANKAFAHYRW